MYDRKVTCPQGLRGERRKQGRREGLSDFSPDSMLLSFHVIHLYVPEGCSVLAAKTSLKTSAEGHEVSSKPLL